jgi:acyl carrier protein
MTTTFEHLCAILRRDYKLAPESLTLDAPLEGLGIDSLGTVELLWNVEDEFNIKLPPEPVLLPTLGDVVLYIDGLIATRDAALVVPGIAVVPTLQAP